MASQQAFNPVIQLSLWGCQQRLHRGLKLAESPGPSSAPPLLCNPIASSQNLPLEFLALSYACFPSTPCTCLSLLGAVLHGLPPYDPLTNTGAGASTLLQLMLVPKQLLLSCFRKIAYKLLSFTWVFHCMPQTLHFLAFIGFLIASLWSAHTFMLAPVHQGRLQMDVGLAHRIDGGQLSKQVALGVLAAVQAIFFCSTWKFLSIAVKVMNNVI